MSEEFRRALMPNRPAVRRRRQAGRGFHIALPKSGLSLRNSAKRRPSGRVRPRGRSLTIRLAPGPRWLSFLLLLATLGGVIGLVVRDEFYVVTPVVNGLKTIPLEEVLAAAPVDGLQVFWVNERVIEASLKSLPSVADVQVTVRLPNTVEIKVQERVPALAWRQAGAVTWLDATGRPMPARAAQPDLLTVTAENVTTPLGPGESLQPEIVAGALALKALRPDIQSLQYYPRGGLTWNDPRGWQVFFGTGANMDQRLQVYDALVQDLSTRSIHPQYIVVDDVQHPFYKAVN